MCFFCDIPFLLSDFDIDSAAVDIVLELDIVDVDNVDCNLILIDYSLFLHDFDCNFDCFFCHVYN